MASRKFGGYDYSFVDKNLEKFTCDTICTKVLKDPHLTGCCGQHVCESCLENWFTANYYKESCPHCRVEGKEFKHFLDKKFKREIDSLRIHCTNKEEGCKWLGELGSLKGHLKATLGCDYVEVECPNKCMVLVSRTGLSYKGSSDDSDDDIVWQPTVKKIQRRALKDHLKNECYLRSHTCEHCGYNDTYVAITGHHPNHSVRKKNYHYAKCPEFPLECSNKCGRNDIKRKDMKNHRRQCPEEPVQCPFEEAGCKKKLVRRELLQHLSATQHIHLLMVMGAYKEMKKAHKRTMDELDQIKKGLNRKRLRRDYESDSTDPDEDLFH